MNFPPQIDGLPDELILSIFALLPSEALCSGGAVWRSCQRWRALCRCPTLWRRRDAVYELSTSPTSTFCRTLAVAPQLRSVVFKNSILPETVVDKILQVRRRSELNLVHPTYQREKYIQWVERT